MKKTDNTPKSTAPKRTGNYQTELTATGVITTAEETVRIQGKKHTKWVQIGYTSLKQIEDENGKAKMIPDGPIGKRLAESA